MYTSRGLPRHGRGRSLSPDFSAGRARNMYARYDRRTTPLKPAAESTRHDGEKRVEKKKTGKNENDFLRDSPSPTAAYDHHHTSPRRDAWAIKTRRGLFFPPLDGQNGPFVYDHNYCYYHVYYNSGRPSRRRLRGIEAKNSARDLRRDDSPRISLASCHNTKPPAA